MHPRRVRRRVRGARPLYRVLALSESRDAPVLCEPHGAGVGGAVIVATFLMLGVLVL